ncbi:FAD-dependent oxidoreductase [Streptomyces sp. SD15]
MLRHPDAGTVDADATVAATTRRAVERGARLLTGTRVAGAESRPDGRVDLATDSGQEVVADVVVVAAGAWPPELAPPLGVPAPLPPQRVTQQQVFHFRQHDPQAAWPVFVHKQELQLFGLPSGSDGGPNPSVKVTQHDEGTPTTASARDGVVNPISLIEVASWVRERLPGLKPTPLAEATCLYTTTPDEDFVLDRVGPFVIVSPCSGQGAKHAADRPDGRRPGPRHGTPASLLRPGPRPADDVRKLTVPFPTIPRRAHSMDTGSTAWILALTLMLPGLALFYGGKTATRPTLNMISPAQGVRDLRPGATAATENPQNTHAEETESCPQPTSY